MSAKRFAVRYLWVLVSVASAALYFYSSYAVEKPYWCGPEFPDALDFNCSPKRVQSVVVTALATGAPALLSIYLGRKAPLFLVVWALGLSYWAYVVASAPLFIDGRHGCVLCDDIELLMVFVSWGTCLFAAVVWLHFKVRRMLRPT